MARVKTMKIIITFRTTTQAMKMERCAREAGISGRLIPVPRQISSGCGMAWCSPVELKHDLTSLIGDQGVEVEEAHELLL